MDKDIYCIFSLFDRNIKVQTLDKSIDETISIEDINNIADFCQQNHISTIHLMTNEQYGLEYKNTLSTYMKTKYGYNVVEVKNLLMKKNQKQQLALSMRRLNNGNI